MISRTPLALAIILGTSAWGQSVISAHSGVIHLSEGQVSVDGKDVVQKFGEFGDVKTGQTLTTQDGRAEVLLTPGVFLRVGENSSFKMVQNKLYDTRIEVISGAAMVQVSELLEDNAITLLYHGTTVGLEKKGLYRVDADKGVLRVFDGEAKVASGSKDMTARKGREVQLDAELTAKNFDTKDTDAFYRWNERRDEYISEANVYAAKSARDSGLGFNSGYGYGTGAGAGAWAYNPWFGMFTYMPYSGMYYSPFGYGYFSPGMVGYLYMPGSPYYGGGYGSAYGTGRTVSNPGTVARNAPSSAIGSGLSAARTGFSSTGGMGIGGIHGGGPMLGGPSMGGGASGGGGMASGGGLSGGGGMSGGAMSGGGGGGRGGHH